jgi:transposase InsO family protein
LDLVHVDLHGPMKTPTMSGAKYFLLLVDDFSRKMWVYFLNKKSDCFSKFVAWKYLVEKQTGKQVKALRSDNGGEFVSTQFKELCKREGIHRKYTTPYTPQQNGVVERRNRTVMEMERCMVHNQNVPYQYWERSSKYCGLHP